MDRRAQPAVPRAAGRDDRGAHRARRARSAPGGARAGHAARRAAERASASTRRATRWSSTYDATLARGEQAPVETRRFEARVPVSDETVGGGRRPALNQARQPGRRRSRRLGGLTRAQRELTSALRRQRRLRRHGLLDPAAAEHALAGIEHRRLPRRDAIFGRVEASASRRRSAPAPASPSSGPWRSAARAWSPPSQLTSLDPRRRHRQRARAGRRPRGRVSRLEPHHVERLGLPPISSPRRWPTVKWISPRCRPSTRPSHDRRSRRPRPPRAAAC